MIVNACKLPVAQLFPPSQRNALVDLQNWPAHMRPARIDAITDELVRMGLVRPRSEDTMPRRVAKQELGA